MKLNIFSIIFFFLFYTINNVEAQSFVLKGKIYDAVNETSLPGANIIFSTGEGTAANEDGKFSIELPAGQYSYTATFTGYERKAGELNISQDTILNIALSPILQSLEQVVVTAGKYETPISEVTVSMEVLGPELLQSMNNTSMDEAIQKTPGVTIQDGQVNIRGGSGYSYGAGSRVLILLDGMPLLTGDAGFPSWSFFPLETIEQVEVIKGASSALYGSSALNGVINLRTTYVQNEPETRIEFFSGFYGKPEENITSEPEEINFNIVNGDTLSIDTTFREKAWWNGDIPFYTGASLLHKQRFGRVDVVAGAYLYSENSYLQNDYARRARFNINTRYRTPINGLSLSLGSIFMVNRSSNFFMWQGDSADAYIPMPNTMSEAKGIKLLIDPSISYFDQKNNRHHLSARFYKNDNYAENEQSTLSDLIYGEYQYQHHFDNAEMVVTAGVTGSYTTVEAELYGDTTHHSSNGAVYFQADKKFLDKLNVSAGARYETNQINDEERESKPVIRAGANYQLGKATFIRASYGQGYRFPTIAEKYIRTGIGLISIYPNLDLRSETGWSAEFGVKQGLQFSSWKGYADVAVFYNAYQDMMEFSFGGADGTLFGFQSINVGDTKIAGVEVSVAGEGSIGKIPLRVLAGYTYIDPKFAVFDSIAELYSSADYNILKYRFRHTAKINLLTEYKKFYSGIAAEYFSEMEAIDRVFELFIPGVADFRENHAQGEWIINLEAGLKITAHARLSVIIKNILNEEYTLRPALIEAPRSYTLKCTYKL